MPWWFKNFGLALARHRKLALSIPQSSVSSSGGADVFGPSPAAFKDCGRILAAMSRKDGVPFRDRPRSLVHDILLAASCRERGVVLITGDRDYRSIAPYLRGFTHVPPWTS